MREHLHALEAEGRRRILSTRGVVVSVKEEPLPCSRCGGPTVVQKATAHHVASLEHGAFVARETVRVCARRCTHPSGELVTQRSRTLSQRVPRGGVYAYDLEVRVGLDRYLRHRQRLEIQRDLEDEQGISISTGEISLLAVRFLEHLDRLHRARAPVIREALASDGGYPLHIDATGEDGRGTLFAAYAGWRQWVLGAWKLSTERADQILPRLRDVVTTFGPPCAIVRDLGRAVTSAANDLVIDLDLDIPILACHKHFAGDVGEGLLKASHDELRELVRRYRLMPDLRKLARDLGRRLGQRLPMLRGDVAAWAESPGDHSLPGGPAGLAVVRSLAQWAMDYSQDGEYGTFPFDRPYYDMYLRCRKVRRAADAFLRNSPRDARLRQALERLARILDPVLSEVPFGTIARRLASRAVLFDELRHALRLGPAGSSDPGSSLTNPRSAQDAAVELQDVRVALGAFTERLREQRPERGPAQDIRQAIDLVLDHMDRHGDSLWGHVISLPVKAGGGIRIVARTNNDLEGLWHVMKHGERRRSGRKTLTHDFECLPAAAALVQNLTHGDYTEILCGSLDRLPATFADLDAGPRARSRPSGPQAPTTDVESASLPHRDRPVLRGLPLRKRIEAAARSRAPRHQLSGIAARTRPPNRVLTR